MRITMRALRENWRDPEWAFHNETTYWYDLDGRHKCLCAQDCKIHFSETSGIGYDVAIPGRYNVFVDEIDDRRTVTRSARRTFDVTSHAELKRLAVGWIHETFRDT